MHPGDMGNFANVEPEVPGTELSLKSPQGLSSFDFSRGVIRTFGVLDRDKLQDRFSLDLSMGCASGSYTSMDRSAFAGYIVSSVRGTGYNNVTGADSEYHFRPGNGLFPDAKTGSCGEEMGQLELNLTLSLSTGPPKSVITNSVSMCSPQLQRNIEMGATSHKARFQLVDGGSTSVRWNVEHLGPPLGVTRESCPVGLQSSCRDIVSLGGPVSTLPALLYTSNDAVSDVQTIQKPQKTKSRICQVIGCGRGARGASGRCISHGGGKRCERPGCLKGAEGRTVFCKAHGGGRRCEHLGCTKTAEGRTDFCIAHGGGRRCSHEGCIHASRGKSGLCIRHGGGKRCQKENCTKSAEGSSGFCISHGGGRRCQKPGCTKGAQGSTMFCKGHGGGRRCTALGCTKGAEGSTQFCKGHGGGKRCSYGGGGVCPKSVHGGTLFCVRHGGGKRCAASGCTKSARGKTSHCVRHGGGKRCQHEGCTKSAQGSTDFCKAHGGGKLCSWLELSSVVNDQPSSPCDKFVRGKSGLCAFHATVSKDKRVHGGDLLGPNMPNFESSPSKKMKENVPSGSNHVRERKTIDDFAYNLPDGFNCYSSGSKVQKTFMNFTPEVNFPVNIIDAIQCPVPEGRVHGGNIMKFLRDNLGPNSNYC
ncbi:hypothetical protein QQ045_029215 [Rhodiola kirilowii]